MRDQLSPGPIKPNRLPILCDRDEINNREQSDKLNNGTTRSQHSTLNAVVGAFSLKLGGKCPIQECITIHTLHTYIALSDASKLASTYLTLFYRSVHVLYTGICILGGCLCWVDSLSPRVAVTQLFVFNCRLESNICA